MAAAAFYDLEGTLVSTNLVHTLGFYARNQPNLIRSVTKSVATLVSVPLFAVSDQYSRKVFNDLFFKRYKGETEDRMRFFADDLFEKVLKPAIYPGTFELIEKSRSLGLRQVVVTGALDVSVKPLMEYLGITDYVANRLEFVKGLATGRLLPPVLAAATKSANRLLILTALAICLCSQLSDIRQRSIRTSACDKQLCTTIGRF